VLLAVGAGVLLVLLVGGGLALLFLLPPRADPGPQLIGRWKGAPDVREDARKVLKDATQDKLPPAAGDIAGGLLQMISREVAAVTIDFKKSGTAFFSGNTVHIGVPADSDGPWEIVQRDGDVLIVRMGPAGSSIEARLAFRDKDTFVLTRPNVKDQSPVVFARVTD
jgi:hypothetical protein